MTTSFQHWPTPATRLIPGALAATLLLMPSPTAGQIGPESFEPMKARSIGPAGMSGRVAAVDVNLSDQNVVYVGSSTGGVWRSRDGGIQWEPIFDDQPVLGIGAVTVFQANPDVVWVGTGEGNPRNSAGVGAGVFKSLDGGDSWELTGLEGSERIHRLVTHPIDPDVVFAGVLGPAWSDGEERGVYRTRDGGETWERVLFVNARTGAADLVMDPGNPNKLLAALWEYRRWPWSFGSGGPGSGLYLTHDGGDTWQRLTEEDGLPSGELGRMGLAFAPSNPEVVFALVEAERNVLLRSSDGGRSWERVSDVQGVNPRPFYYADIRVDPGNENRIYRLASSLDVSEDGGRSFRTVVPSSILHGDVHELWIHPSDPRFMIMGNDGGIGFSFNRGGSWRFVENLPLAQFYHVNVDMQTPFNIYGGLQDNGSWFGPSQVWEEGGIMNAHWRRTGGGDGFASLPDFSQPRFGYSMSQQGSLMRFDKVTGERREIQPLSASGEPLRFNWNAGLNVDPHDSVTIYLGSQFVHRSRDRGLSWETISPDLTTDDPGKQRQEESGGLTMDATGAENHTTILSIAPSPLEAGEIWVTTDDGNVQLSLDDGESWTNLRDRIRGVPQGTWSPHVEPSKHMRGTAYVVFDDHRRGDWAPYLYRTRDRGESWDALPTQEVRGFIHVIEEDPVHPNLLFLGTEFGLYVSLNGGSRWMPWRAGIPPVPVRALTVHPRDHDLVIGTHGRGAFILDDIRPLRALASEPDLASRAIHFFEPPPALLVTRAERIGYRSTGHGMYFGENRPPGALISLWIGGESAGSSVDVAILDESGELLRSFQQPVTPGVNRFTWDLRSLHPPGGQAGRQGVPVLPGRYRIRASIAGSTAETYLTVLPDPRSEIRPEERVAKREALVLALGWMALSEEAEGRLVEAVRAIDFVLDGLAREGEGSIELREEGESLRSEVEAAIQRLFSGPPCQGICGGDPVAAPVRRLVGILESSADGPSPNDRLAITQAETAVRQVVREVNQLFDGPVAGYRRMLAESGYTPFPVLPALSAGGGG